MRIFYIVLLLFPLAGCDQLQQADASAKKFLATLDKSRQSTGSTPELQAAATAEKQGDFAQAAEIYRQGLEKQPDNKDMQLLLADSYRQSGKEDDAIALYDTLIAQNAKPIEAKEGKGLALLAKGDFNAPATLFEQVMAADPARWKTLNALGVLFTTRNMHSEAQQYFQEALKFSPANPSVLNNIGLSQALEHRYTDAFQNLILASGFAAEERQRRRIDLNLALVYGASGRLSDARAIAARYYSGSQLYNNLGLYARLAKDEQLAKDYLNMALAESKAFYDKPWNNLQSMGSDGAEVVAPVSAPKPAKAKAKPKARSKPKPTPKPEPVLEPKPEVKPDLQPEAKPDPVPEPRVEPKPEPKPKKSKADERLSDILNAVDE